ncbi:P-loop containing nucleoside triphosphate hydrolase protein [Suillus subalutaceus]|uniref:P-loop containing nucleoside triphosphate hydrolase protein n=1 Tax=Suillus subalutaceus TaxID=48586 RepID=UPI001B884039|nr:P-loop containing nucleoside triphosphate hydrolase protein [Suillus subalutaceus]KAG1843152.1 P-loop containing nucleoside triphosphate hydrolase protein [Suillus subalutaceus]
MFTSLLTRSNVCLQDCTRLVLDKSASLRPWEITCCDCSRMQPNEPVIPGALAENVPERPLIEKTEKAEHHYLRRWQIWAKEADPTKQTPAQGWNDQGWGAPPVEYAWQPYDPSSIQPAPPREDVDNFFYLNIRYTNRDAEPDVVFSHFSNTLIDFLRMSIGDEFFDTNPDSSLTHFVFKLDELKAHLSDARSALSNLSGEELRTKAQELGRLDSLTPQQTEQDAQQYLEDLVNQLDVLIPLVEKEFEPISKRLELELSYGHISFDLLLYYFKKGERYYYEFLGDKLAFVLEDTSMDSSFRILNINGHGMIWDGLGHIHEHRGVDIPRYPGTKALSDLQCKIVQDDVHNELTERGRLYTAVSGVHFKSYDGRRVVIDENGYCGRDPGDYDDYVPPRSSRKRVTSPPAPGCGNAGLSRPDSPYAGDNSGQELLEFPEDQLYLLPVKVHGFDVRRKTWETIDVRKLEEIHFDEHAWDHLVLNKATKVLVKGLVNVTKTTNTSGEVFSDVITGKGGGMIALLHGPPGTGKTLTAEAVAEHLKRPLYVLSSLELSTTPATLEKNLGDVLRLATTWDAVVLIDEADVFLEQRSLHELERNALVSVALRVLEYHRGVLFLTTNRIQAFDEAFLSRFSIAVKYPELDVDARLTIWRKFFELAGCELWGGSGQPGDGRQSPDEFVKLEGQEPQCYVSLADLKELAAKPFNGRTIKNLVRTAQALAMSSDEPLSLEHVKVVVEAQEKFLTEFAKIKL